MGSQFLFEHPQVICKNFYSYFDPPPPPPPPNVVLDNDINEVMDELKNVLARYEGIGGRLNIPNGRLEEIREQHLIPAKAMRRVIVEWVKRNYPNSSSNPPTWKVLVDAVEHPLGGNDRAEAEEIASRHKASESSCMFHYCKLFVQYFPFYSRQLGTSAGPLTEWYNIHTLYPLLSKDPTGCLAYKRKIRSMKVIKRISIVVLAIVSQTANQ